MEKDKQHLVNIEKVEINNIYTNHVDTGDILSQLHILKMQNKKILELLLSNDEAAQLEQQMDKWLVKLNKSVDVIKAVSDQVK